MISLGKLVQLGNVSNEAIEWISLAPTAAIGNQRILDFMLISIRGEESLLEFCDVLEKLIEHPALLKVVENLRNGNERCSMYFGISVFLIINVLFTICVYPCCVCVHVYLCVCAVGTKMYACICLMHKYRYCVHLIKHHTLNSHRTT